MTNALPEILNTTPVATSRLFSIEQVDLRFSNGTETCFERLVGEGEGAVMVAILKGDAKVTVASRRDIFGCHAVAARRAIVQ